MQENLYALEKKIQTQINEYRLEACRMQRINEAHQSRAAQPEGEQSQPNLTMLRRLLKFAH